MDCPGIESGMSVVRNVRQELLGLLLPIALYCFACMFVDVVDLTEGVERLSEETGGGVEEHDIKPYKSRTAVKISSVP
jgi:hypothetical protein